MNLFTSVISTLYVMICLFVLQLLDLFMVWDWSTYLADYGQPTSKYLRVNPSTALALLEKSVFLFISPLFNYISCLS